MNKNNIYVSVRTPEERQRFLDICRKHKEEIYSATRLMLKLELTGTFYLIHEASCWIGNLNSFITNNKTLITLDQLESMLCGKGEDKTDNKAQILDKHHRELVKFTLSKEDLALMAWSPNQRKAVMDAMQEYADQQTSYLRKELEELKEKSRELINEATKVYSRYNELIKHKDEFMDFQTLYELNELLNPTP